MENKIEEPTLKKKSLVDKIIHNQFIVTIFTCFMVFIVVVGSSYAIFSSKGETGLEDVVIKTGNLQVVLSSSDDMLKLDYDTLGVSDIMGMEGHEYTFTVKNTSKNDIGYYEIKIVDKEYEISTLPHKAIKYVLNHNDNGYSKPVNLEDTSSYIYYGGPLKSGETDNFKLKLWVSDEDREIVRDKVLNASMEITLYQELTTRNYIIYDLNGANGYIPRTNILKGVVTNFIPTYKGKKFLGWSKDKNSDTVDYYSGSKYDLESGTTLYAVWQ